MPTVTYRITISNDDCAEDPRGWSSVGKMYCEHSQYKLGDGSLDEFLQSIDYEGDNRNIGEICEYLNKSGYAVPISMTEHSCINVYRGAPNDPWDAGYLGVYYVENRNDMTDEELNDNIDGELNEYNHYLNGEYYCYLVEKTVEMNGWTKTEQIDSCGGYSEVNFCETEARECVPKGYEPVVRFV